MSTRLRMVLGVAMAGVAVAAAATAAGQPVPRSERYIGETRPGAGVVEIVVTNRRITEMDIQHRFWRCTGPEAGRREMGWSLDVFGPANATIRPSADGRFRYRYAESGGGTYSRFTVAGRFTDRGQRFSGTFTWSRRGIRRDGPVECRTTTPVRFTAWVTMRDFSGTTSQGVPVRARVTWIKDLMAWIRGRPPYIQGGFGPVIGLTPPPSPFTAVLLPCTDGHVETEQISGRVNPGTGVITPRAATANSRVTLTGRVSPLAGVAPGRVSLSMSAVHTAGEVSCSGTATFEATELVSLTP